MGVPVPPFGRRLVSGTRKGQDYQQLVTPEPSTGLGTSKSKNINIFQVFKNAGPPVKAWQSLELEPMFFTITLYQLLFFKLSEGSLIPKFCFKSPCTP